MGQIRGSRPRRQTLRRGKRRPRAGVPIISPSILSRIAAGLAIGLALCSPHSARADEPKTVHIAGVLYDGVESAWEKSFVDSFARVKAQHPHGVEIDFQYTEHVGYDQAEQVIRDYADTGKFDIIFTDSSYADAIEKIRGDYPKTLFVFSGAKSRGSPMPEAIQV